jgi:salicylate hydroxylase
LQNPDLKAYPHFHHKENAPTYAKGHVCIMGDAAHAMTPWQGSGAGQAIEDAMILETVLGIVREPRQLDAAFRAYDEVRRARTQRIVESSKVTGVIMCGKAPDVGLDVDALRKALAGRWAFIYALDMAQHKKDALAAMATQ